MNRINVSRYKKHSCFSEREVLYIVSCLRSCWQLSKTRNELGSPFSAEWPQAEETPPRIPFQGPLAIETAEGHTCCRMLYPTGYHTGQSETSRCSPLAHRKHPAVQHQSAHRTFKYSQDDRTINEWLDTGDPKIIKILSFLSVAFLANKPSKCVLMHNSLCYFYPCSFFSQ